MSKINKVVVKGVSYVIEDKNTASKALHYDSFNAIPTANAVNISGKSVDGSNTLLMGIPAATTSTAGVMTAEDKRKLDNVPSTIEDAIAEEAKVTDEKIAKESKATDEKIAKEIDKIKNGDTIVAQAREIHSRNGKNVTDSFLARTTAGSGTIGDGVASLKSVGGNIVKNLVDGTFEKVWSPLGSSDVIYMNDIVIVKTSATWQGVSCGFNCVINHKYYIGANFNADKRAYMMINSATPQGTGYVTGNAWIYISAIVTGTETIDTFAALRAPDANTTFIATKPRVIDLTERFGAGNEPDKGTCDRLFGNMDALPQGLNFAKPTEFKSTGFNQFNTDNVLEGKAIVDNGIVNGDKMIAVIPCLPCKVGVGENNGYCIHGDFGDDIKVYLTPLNPMEVDGELYMHELTKDATTGTYVPQIKGYLLVEVPTTDNLCVHFLWSEDKCERDNYEPYFESKIELPTIPQMSEYGLAGIQSSGTLVCDEIDFEKSVYRKKIKDVELSQHGWWKHNPGMCIYFCDMGKNTNGINNALLCERYSIVKYGGTLIDSIPNKCMMFGGGRYIYIRDDDYTTNIDFKNSLTGLYAYYAIATPEEYPLPKVDNNYISSDYGVEQFDSVVPCNANNLYYMRSLAGETRNFLDRLMAGLGTSDATVVADRILAVVNPAVEPANVEPEIPIEE